MRRCEWYMCGCRGRGEGCASAGVGESAGKVWGWSVSVGEWRVIGVSAGGLGVGG